MFKVGDKIIRIDGFEDIFEPKNNLKSDEIYEVSKVNITGSTMTDLYLRGKTRRYNPTKFRLAYKRKTRRTFICKNPKNLPKE